MNALKRLVLPTYLGLGLLYLFLPVLVVILFSFNDYQGRFNVRWQGFTFEHWLDPLAVEEIPQALGVSMVVAAVSSGVATIIGTLIALALTRYHFKGRSATSVLLFFP
ncbi:MAG: ABC transporter permease, partial [bacterium]